MKNYEKYAEEIKNFGCERRFCNEFVQPHILNSSNCGGIDCYNCQLRQMIWLLEEYEEPEVNWSEVEVDTPILVRDNKNTEWIRRHFAKYEDGVIYTWDGGSTSWTSRGNVTEWKHAKLADGGEE